jgi:hypothetical protein
VVVSLSFMIIIIIYVFTWLQAFVDQDLRGRILELQEFLLEDTMPQ